MMRLKVAHSIQKKKEGTNKKYSSYSNVRWHIAEERRKKEEGRRKSITLSEF
ncbi:hypothetical protein [Okeania sp. KiyG1]|uniref:hypothetical protein n=1 Tax=Okeania sp. KiyG1 TaxID=2720165 RepID=UPI001920E936|nr:hypothetical protein [Okeania sp. KiyG1]